MNAKTLVAFGTGVLFSVGLAISGMTQPSKVVGFLDVFGDWDPSLACVMGAALVVNALLFRLVLKRDRPILDTCFDLPTQKGLEWRLVVGGGLFGVGWGMAGYCPGPALTSVATGAVPALVFSAAMVAGMVLHKRLDPAMQ
jgi:uncharacterized membrane protein YedE/YeeE